MKNRKMSQPEPGETLADSSAVDPEVVVGNMVIQAEVLRIQTEVALSTHSQADAPPSRLRDLSPLGR
jgi:hypothetical protein